MEIKPEKNIDELFRLLDKQALLIHKATLEKHHNRELRFDEVVDLEDAINEKGGGIKNDVISTKW